MPEPLRKLNSAGLLQFSMFINDRKPGSAPIELLSNRETSDHLPVEIYPGAKEFPSRYEFGAYLNDLFKSLPMSEFSGDSGFWSATALYYFDQICPIGPSGTRKYDKDYRYILSSDYRHYYRHAVRSPWDLVRRHGEQARLLLASPQQTEWPLSTHGEILEQLGSRQQILSSRTIISVANALYFDKVAGRPKRGVAGSGRGSARRFGLVLRQLELTYDPESMPIEAFRAVLPKEFDRWKGASDLESN